MASYKERVSRSERVRTLSGTIDKGRTAGMGTLLSNFAAVIMTPNGGALHPKKRYWVYKEPVLSHIWVPWLPARSRSLIFAPQVHEVSC